MDNQITTKLSSITSWLVFIVFMVIFLNMSFTPRVPTESLERKVLTNFHLVVGTLLFVLSFFRVYLWVYYPPQNTQRLLPDHEYTQMHILQFMLYVAFIAQGISIICFGRHQVICIAFLVFFTSHLFCSLFCLEFIIWFATGY